MCIVMITFFRNFRNKLSFLLKTNAMIRNLHKTGNF
jgi:hypothetical protein